MILTRMVGIYLKCPSVFAGLATMMIMMFGPGLIAKRYHAVQTERMDKVCTMAAPQVFG